MSLRVFRAGVAVATLAVVAAAATVALSSPPARTASSPLGEHSQCAAYAGLPPDWGRETHAGMIHVAAGSFLFGSERGYAEERPAAERHVDGFWIDRTEVTNAEFASFVAATGYVTEAERNDGAAVFIAPSMDHAPSMSGGWWHLLKEANWRHPDGADSGIEGRTHDPVVDVTYADALAYAHWLGRDLPSEVEWEYAARAGADNAIADAAVRDAQGHWRANVWQGLFPFNDNGEDGFSGRAPVGCFPANDWGLHDMVGNVWEWTLDPWQDRHAVGGSPMATPQAPDRRVIKGGSFLCSSNYCSRARASSRQGQEANLPTSHIGFRTILRD